MLAIEKNIQGLSITDHDTLEAYNTALPFAEERDFPLLPGVELSTVFKGESIHVLGYAFDLSSPHLQAFCQRQKQLRQERNLKIIEKLKQKGIEIEVIQGDCIGRPHIAKALMQKGIISTIQEGFDKYLGEGKSAYVPGNRPDVHQAIDVIKKAKGKAVIAHPHLIAKKRVLKALLDMPFDGIECYYAKMPLDRVTPFLKIAKDKGWLVTGGSDYHGTIKPNSQLGNSWVDKNHFEALYAHFQAH